MPYNFELAVSATISKKIAEDMIRTIVEQQTGKKIASINVRLNKVSKGMGPSETTETVFDGFQVFFVAENTTATPPGGQRPFIKDSYK